MTKESRQSLEEVMGIANITNALVVQMAELLKLREAVISHPQAHICRGCGLLRTGVRPFVAASDPVPSLAECSN